MATFGELVSKVSVRLKDPDNKATKASDVANVLNDAIQHWSKKRFWFNEFEENVTLAIDNPKFVLVDNDPLYLFQKDGVVINFASARWPMKKISSIEYDRMNTEGRGLPFSWTERNQGFEVYWYPDADYTAVVRGIRAYERFAEDTSDYGQSNDFTIKAADLIMYEALARLFGEFRQDPKMEAYYSARTKNEYQSLKAQTRRDKATGQIYVRGF